MRSATALLERAGIKSSDDGVIEKRVPGDRIDLPRSMPIPGGRQPGLHLRRAVYRKGHLRYVGGVLQGNVDGDAAAEFEIQLVGTPALVVGGTGTDILL